uniref:Uncharacterized protein n=1 Tax=Astyanax mexicanus TaxID=7994 RepID=A0A8B9R8J1_ASTMX
MWCVCVCVLVVQAWFCTVLLSLLGGSAPLPLDCSSDSASLSRCSSISQEKLMDRVIQHAELISRISDECCTLFEEMFVPYSARAFRIPGGNSCITKAFPIPIPNMLTCPVSVHEPGVVQDDVHPEVLESVLRDYTVLTCFKKDAHRMETFLKLLKCRQTDRLSCGLY